jgi:DNA-binding NtrC family response regulator
MAVQAMRLGAYDFLEKPFSPEQLTEVVQRALEKRALSLEVQKLRSQLAGYESIEARLIGRSPAMQQLRRLVRDVASSDADVLILGETGTGKELVARCLHEGSRRRAGHFAAINCGGMPEALFESEMFGHEAGAFTGAVKRRIGKIEHARGGTLFLDEIETMPMSLQVKMLRALQERQYERLGSNELRPMDSRVVAATKADLLAAAREGRFRDDLYYRLGVVVLQLPPLRERREDIPLLFTHFGAQAALRHERELPPVGARHLEALMAHAWPGNVRELRNIADRFVLGLWDGDAGMRDLARGERTLDEQMAQFERYLINEALEACNGSAAAAAERLGLPRKTLYDKMRRLGPLRAAA